MLSKWFTGRSNTIMKYLALVGFLIVVPNLIIFSYRGNWKRLSFDAVIASVNVYYWYYFSKLVKQDKNDKIIDKLLKEYSL